MKALLLLIAAAALLSGCAGYDAFARANTRSYSLSYQDENGRRIGAAVTLAHSGGGK